MVNSSPPRRASRRTALGGFAQALGDSLQNTVAVVVAERVIDGLEIVDVHEQQAELLTGRRRARQRAAESGRQLAAVGKLRERIVVSEMVELPGALGHMPLELGLVGAQLGFGAGDLRRHRVEGFSQRVDFCRPAARRAGAAVASGLQLGCGSQPPDGHADTDDQQRPTR